MLGQLNSLAKFTKVDEPLHKQFVKNKDKDKQPAKGGGGNVRIVDAAGMAADGEEGEGMI
jgi:hypothetical protein